MERNSTSNAAIFAELLSSQKSRDELMKWKLIVISTLGAAGLGLFESKRFENLHLILAVIPVACVYVDMLCRYLSLRTKRINYFISTLTESNDIDIKYAKFYLSVRNKAGQTLESYALIWSTIFISCIIVITGFLTKNNTLIRFSFTISGILCIVFSFLVEMRYKYEKGVIYNRKK
jgi:uncharacterized membrane protein